MWEGGGVLLPKRAHNLCTCSNEHTPDSHPSPSVGRGSRRRRGRGGVGAQREDGDHEHQVPAAGGQHVHAGRRLHHPQCHPGLCLPQPAPRGQGTGHHQSRSGPSGRRHHRLVT